MSHCQLHGHHAPPSHVRGSAFAVASFLCPSLPSSTYSLPSFISAQASSLCVSKAYPIPVLSSGLILRAIYKEVQAAEGFERTLIHLPTYPYTLTSRLADSPTHEHSSSHPVIPSPAYLCCKGRSVSHLSLSLPTHHGARPAATYSSPESLRL